MRVTQSRDSRLPTYTLGANMYVYDIIIVYKQLATMLVAACYLFRRLAIHMYTLFFGYAVYETDKRRRKKAPRRSLQHYIFCSVVV